MTTGDHGAGVAELIERLLATDLRRPRASAARATRILLGAATTARKCALAALRAQRAGRGHLRQRQVDARDAACSSGWPSAGYQFCIIDPEGDYASFEARSCWETRTGRRWWRR